MKLDNYRALPVKANFTFKLFTNQLRRDGFTVKEMAEALNCRPQYYYAVRNGKFVSDEQVMKMFGRLARYVEKESRPHPENPDTLAGFSLLEMYKQATEFSAKTEIALDSLEHMLTSQQENRLFNTLNNQHNE